MTRVSFPIFRFPIVSEYLYLPRDMEKGHEVVGWGNLGIKEGERLKQDIAPLTKTILTAGLHALSLPEDFVAVPEPSRGDEWRQESGEGVKTE